LQTHNIIANPYKIKLQSNCVASRIVINLFRTVENANGQF
jgi:hypothetical protein